MKDLSDIIPFSATALVVVEEGHVEAVIDGYLFSLTVHEYSNGILKVFLDHSSDTPSSREILGLYGATLESETLDEIHGEEFNKAILDIYRMSNSSGGGMCSWTTTDEVEYMEFEDFV